jgi:hypothetical protein
MQSATVTVKECKPKEKLPEVEQLISQKVSGTGSPVLFDLTESIADCISNVTTVQIEPLSKSTEIKSAKKESKPTSLYEEMMVCMWSYCWRFDGNLIIDGRLISHCS